MTGTHIALSRPIGPISSVTVGIPAEREWDRPPPGVSEALWNLSRSTGLSMEQAGTLADEDLEKIAEAFTAAIDTWNFGQRALRASLTA